MPLYGGAEPAADDSPMDDMPMGEETATFEPKDDEERAYVDAFPEKTFTEDTMAALKEGVRLCIEKNAAGAYSGGGESEEKPPSKGGSGLALIFGEPKKKR